MGTGEHRNEDQEHTVEFDRVPSEPDLTAAETDVAWWEETVRGIAPRSGQNGWHDGEPGTGVRPVRAAWWERAVGSGAGFGLPAAGDAPAALERPQEPRRLPEPSRNTSKPLRSPDWGREISLHQSPKPAQSVKPDRSPRPGRPDTPDHITGPIPSVSPERPISLQPRAVPLQRPAPAVAEPAGSATVARRRQGRIMVGAAALVTVLIAGGVIALVLPRHHANGARASHLKQATRRLAPTKAEVQAASDRAQAAVWVAAQVGHHVKVSCDPVMCQGLIQQGFPASELVQVVHRTPYPLQSEVVVMTPTLQQKFSAGFEARWAPAVLAEFGTGAGAVTVRVIAPHGAGAYRAAVSADLKQRIAAGAGLVTSSQISIVPAPKRAIVAGLVDPRILTLILALAAQHPVSVLSFGQNFPGTTPGTPFRVAVFAETVPASGLTPSQYAASVISLIRAQSAEFRPLRITTVRLPSGRSGLEVQYSGPTPLGVLHP